MKFSKYDVRKNFYGFHENNFVICIYNKKRHIKQKYFRINEMKILAIVLHKFFKTNINKMKRNNKEKKKENRIRKMKTSKFFLILHILYSPSTVMSELF